VAIWYLPVPQTSQVFFRHDSSHSEEKLAPQLQVGGASSSLTCPQLVNLHSC